MTSAQLSMVDQSGPWGSVTYNQTGENSFVDSQGNVVTTPKYTQSTTLSPSQQAIFDRTQQAEQNLAQIAQDQSKFLGGYLGQEMDLSGLPAIQSQFGDGYATTYAGADDFSADRRRYEDALWERTAGDRASQDEALRTRLANSGIQPGSAAWNAEMERMERQNTDARLATILAGGEEQSRMVGLAQQAAQFGNNALAQQVALNNQARQQGISEAFAVRQNPINEITALLSGTQVSNPAQMGAATPQVGVGGVDYTGLVNQNYQNQMNAYGAKMGGLFGLGSAGIGLFSDERLKTDVQRVGTTDGGVPIYTYRYVWGGPVHMGVMAQDVPEAAFEDPSGYLKVDYSRVH